MSAESDGGIASFGVGLQNENTDYPDSVVVNTPMIELGSERKKHRIGLEKGDDLSRLKVGFVVAMAGRRSTVTVYLDSTRFV
ncbi:MAG: hypothetical protein P8X59_02815 [Woeseiaceae bacterium]